MVERNKNGQFVEGGGSGRPKGAVNKATRDIRYIISKILENVSDDDIKEMMGNIKTKKQEVLLSFLGKIAPKKLTVDGEIKNKLLDKLDEYDKDNTTTSAG
jgi:hypothetical protein